MASDLVRICMTNYEKINKAQNKGAGTLRLCKVPKDSFGCETLKNYLNLPKFCEEGAFGN